MSIKDIVLPKSEVIDACRKGDYSKVAFFLSGKKGKKQRTPLNFFRSATDSHWLVEYRDDKSQSTLLHYSACEGQNEISKLLMDYEPLLVICKTSKNILPIHLAAWNGHFEIVKMMMLLPQEKPMDIVNCTNIFKETPLHLAVQRGHVKIIQYLLKKDADPFIRTEYKENALDIAARIGFPEIIRILCIAYPKFPIQSAYETTRLESAKIQRQCPAIYPFHLAAKHNHVDCLKVLREYGFSINYTTEDGTALHVAAACGQADAVRYLLQEGINTEIRNHNGQTVLEMIIDLQQNRRPDITQFVKNPEGWKECRSIIEGLDRRDSGRDSEGSQSDSDIIWQQPPMSDSLKQSTLPLYRPPSLSANLHRTSPESPEADLSVKSDIDYMSRTINRTWNSKMYDKATGIPRFPCTSPWNHSRHNSYQRVSDTLPIKLNAVRTRPSPQRTSILPDKNSPYKNMQPPKYDDWQRLKMGDVVNPISYDNIPTNSITCEKSNTIGRSFSLKRQNGFLTLPRFSDVTVTPKSESSQKDKQLHRNNIAMSRTTCDREDSLGLNHSPKLDTRASSVTSSLTFACSILDNNDGATSSSSSGRAPLALPEEISGSVTGPTIFTTQEKQWSNISEIHGDNYEKTEVKSPVSPPSPNTSKATIFDALYGKSGLIESRNASIFASQSTLGSSPSTISEGSSGSQDATSSKEAVRIRRQLGTSNMKSGPLEVPVPNVDADWERVTSVFETFGAAPCRESVFVRDYESRVAVFLRDRGSKALTVQMIDDAISGKDIFNQNQEQQRESSQMKILAMSEWLETVVGIPGNNVRDISSRLVMFGYDKYTQLKGTISYRDVIGFGIPQVFAEMIIREIKSMEEKRPSANAFFYVSDWLSCLELNDYLSNFLNGGYKNMTTIRHHYMENRFNENRLMEMGVARNGHMKRIMHSLQRAIDEINLRDKVITDVAHPPPRPSRILKSTRTCTECPDVDYEAIKKKLLSDGIIYRAHHLGINEITEVMDTSGAHLAMESIKATIKDWDQFPRVALDLTSNGILVHDEKKKKELARHGVYTIRVVCQDRKDLNIFSYVARDEENRFFCHTFCVLTSDVANEIINAIGIMFELRSRIDKKLPLDAPINPCPHGRHHMTNIPI